MKSLFFVLLALFAGSVAFTQDITLPAPASKVGVDLISAIQNRSVSKAFVKKDVSLADLSTILNAGFGKRSVDAVTSATKSDRTVSFSGDNAYVNAYVLDAKGTYFYDADSKELKLRSAGDSRAALTPEALPNNAFIVLFTANSAAMPPFLKSNPGMFQLMAQETAGAAQQNIALTASALKLSSIVMYNVKPAVAASSAKLPKEETPLFILQLGYTK